MKSLILSVIADDRPGIVEILSDCIAAHNGNWLESRLANLAGKFAGIVRLEVSADAEEALISALQTLQDQGIRVTVDQADQASAAAGEVLELVVTGSDRAGIVKEITSLLSRHGVNVQELASHCENAPMSGDQLFQAQLTVVLPRHLSSEQLAQILEELSDDLLVDID